MSIIKLQIENGAVINLIEVDPASVPDWAADWPDGTGGVGIGWIQTGEGQFEAPPVPAPTNDDVNAERDRRVAAGLTVTLTGGTVVPILGDDTTKTNLQGLALSAQAQVLAGQGAALTAFRDRDNQVHSLTQSQVLELWQACMAYVSAVFQASWALKDNFETIPADYRADSYWPS